MNNQANKDKTCSLFGDSFLKIDFLTYRLQRDQISKEVQNEKL